MTQIDIVFWIPFSLLVMGFIVLAITKTMNWFIAFMGIILGFAVTFWTAELTSVIVTPIRNHIFYGADLSLFVMSAYLYLISFSIIAIVGSFNLMVTKGKRMVL
jgi:hypothetical protein